METLRESKKICTKIHKKGKYIKPQHGLTSLPKSYRLDDVKRNKAK